MPDPAMAALRESLERRGLEPDPLANDPDLPLICKLNLAAPLSVARGSTTSWWMASSGVHGKLARKTSAQRRGFWKRPRTGCATRTVLTLQREGFRRTSCRLTWGTRGSRPHRSMFGRRRRASTGRCKRHLQDLPARPESVQVAVRLPGWLKRTPASRSSERVQKPARGVWAIRTELRNSSVAQGNAPSQI